jgi:hypothetical protein
MPLKFKKTNHSILSASSGLRFKAIHRLLRGVAQAILARILADDETGWAPALKIHGPATVGPAVVPGDMVELAFAADDGFVRVHNKSILALNENQGKDLF